MPTPLYLDFSRMSYLLSEHRQTQPSLDLQTDYPFLSNLMAAVQSILSGLFRTEFPFPQDQTVADHTGYCQIRYQSDLKAVEIWNLIGCFPIAFQFLKGQMAADWQLLIVHYHFVYRLQRLTKVVDTERLIG